MLEGKRVMYYNQKGDRHPRGTLELNAGSRLKKIPTREHAFHVVSDKQVCMMNFALTGEFLPSCRNRVQESSGVMPVVDNEQLFVSFQPVWYEPSVT